MRHTFSLLLSEISVVKEAAVTKQTKFALHQAAFEDIWRLIFCWQISFAGNLYADESLVKDLPSGG